MPTPITRNIKQISFDPIDMIAKPKMQVRIQKQIGFIDKYVLYVDDEEGQTFIRIGYLTDDQIDCSGLIG